MAKSILNLLRCFLSRPSAWVDTDHKLGFRVEMLMDFHKRSNEYWTGIKKKILLRSIHHARTFILM